MKSRKTILLSSGAVQDQNALAKSGRVCSCSAHRGNFQRLNSLSDISEGN
ncbi:MAG: hypothetical protein MRZ79_04895 [Bacteroidia bacterium]|nr:hypothetical protein [Bacteroidia bacterium]